MAHLILVFIRNQIFHITVTNDFQYRIWDNRTDVKLTKAVFSQNIIDVKYRSDYFCIILENKINIMPVKDLSNKHKFTTRPNTFGVAAFSKNEDIRLCAFPGDEEEGDIVIYNLDTKNKTSIFANYSKNGYDLT